MKSRSFGNSCRWLGCAFIVLLGANGPALATERPAFAWGGGTGNGHNNPCAGIDNGVRFAQRAISDIDTIPPIIIGESPCPPLKGDAKQVQAKFHWKNAPGRKDITFMIDPKNIQTGLEKTWSRAVDGGSFGDASEVHYKIVSMSDSPSGYGIVIDYAEGNGMKMPFGTYSDPPPPIPITFTK